MKSFLDRYRINHPEHATQPMQILKSLILTQRGWIIRQVLKLAAAGGTIATTWLVSHSVHVDGRIISAALATVATGLAEMALSKFSDTTKLKALGVEQ